MSAARLHATATRDSLAKRGYFAPRLWAMTIALLSA